MATEYAKSRYAFSRQIGSFQAIKHKLADMYVNIEVARSNAYYGAWALSTEAAELPFAAAASRAAASDAYYFCAKENIQTHGGMGFTWEVDCHLFYPPRQIARCAGGQPGGVERKTGEASRTAQRGLRDQNNGFQRYTPKKPSSAPKRARFWKPMCSRRAPIANAVSASSPPAEYLKAAKAYQSKKAEAGLPASPGPRSRAGAACRRSMR
jgi:hypothetical protein